MPRLLVGGTVAIGLAYLGTAIAPTLVVACVASAVGGAGNGVQWVAVVTAIQELTAEAYQARVIGLLESLASGLSGVGFLLGGAIAAIALAARELRGRRLRRHGRARGGASRCFAASSWESNRTPDAEPEPARVPAKVS